MRPPPRPAPRRLFLMGLASAGLSAGWPTSSFAADAAQRRQQYRLELWQTFSRKTQNLVARYTSVRHSSMLYEPLQNAGSLGFVAPDTLVLRDDDIRGSTTHVEGGSVSILPNDEALPRSPIRDPETAPGLSWLRDRLVALFSPHTIEELRSECVIRAPRGRTPRLEFLPVAGSMVRKTVRSIHVTLDPVGGAMTRIEVGEAQGDRLRLDFSDHRQNVDDSELAPLLTTARERTKPAPGE